MTQPLERTTLKGGDTVLHARTTLVFYHRDGAQVAQLELTRPLVVGRAAPSDIEIPDPGLSRQHARFTWDDHGIWVEDLDSTNGTKKNGAAVRHARITPGDEIAIGPVMVSVHVISSIDDELRGFDGHDRFVAALADEITRARTFVRPLALLMVRAAAKDGHVSRWASRLRMVLRPVDRVGIYGPAAVLVALPEATPEMVRAVTAALSGGEPALVCGAVTYPGDGASADELIAALQVATRSGGRASAKETEAPAVVIKNPAMKEVMATVKRLAGSTINVLIHGETGTGKEVLARAIHEGGPRKKRPLRSVNCAAIPGTLIESMLFGHEQGAFTGADKPARGIFEQADGGTVLLDEIGELAASAQAALLRVLETRKVTRVGGEKEIAVDVRVIAATHRDLESMVDAGRFRQDLLYRLNTVTVRLPPLRERVDEIRPLAERFLKEARKQSGSEVRTIDGAALAALEAYGWPGNVRELRNVIERAVVLAEGTAIRLEDLTDRVRGSRVSGARAPAAELDPVRTTGPIASVAASRDPGAPVFDAPGDYKEHLRRYEADLILRALHKANGNQTEAAKALNLPLRTLVHKIQTYGIKKKFDR
ncbi:MAG TPA: sigma 54-interacting transcriptional regulator [Kofleriaceae bacterium]|nr:sigma 54-interacting transcriptional regulator [Kofleriaceae bacterium]